MILCPDCFDVECTSTQGKTVGVQEAMLVIAHPDHNGSQPQMIGAFFASQCNAAAFSVLGLSMPLLIMLLVMRLLFMVLLVMKKR